MAVAVTARAGTIAVWTAPLAAAPAARMTIAVVAMIAAAVAAMVAAAFTAARRAASILARGRVVARKEIPDARP
jgi:hypothetical protein